MSIHSAIKIRQIEPDGRIRWIEIDFYLHSWVHSNFSSNASIQGDTTNDKEIQELLSLVNPGYDEEPKAFLDRLADSVIEIGELMENHFSVESAVEEIMVKQNLKFNLPHH